MQTAERISEDRVLDQLPYEVSGIMNLHLIFDGATQLAGATPDEIRQAAKNYANGQAFYPTNRAGYCYQLIFRPLKRGGVLAALDGTEHFQRLHGCRQLSLHDQIPAPNSHTRADHSIFLGTLINSTLSSMIRRSPEQFLARAEQDLKTADLMDEVETKADLVALTAKLGSAIAVLHDLATIAGGERIKNFLKTLGRSADEEILIKEMMFSRPGSEFYTQPFMQMNRNLRERLGQFGIFDKHLNFIFECIAGKSDSLLGNLMHPKADSLDLDRAAYILLDNKAAGVFAQDLPSFKLPDISQYTTKDELITKLNKFRDLLANPSQMLKSPPQPVFPWNTLDPSQDMFLDDKGRVVYGIPTKVLALTLAREYGFRFYYLGTMMQGIESTLGNRIEAYVKKNSGKLPEILELPYLLSHTDQELLRELSKLPDPKIQEIAGCLRDGAIPPFFSSEYVDRKQAKAGWFNVDCKIKHGMETLVKDQGKVMTLGRYMAEHPHDPLVMQTRYMMGYQQNGVLVITPKKHPEDVIFQPRLPGFFQQL